MLITNQTLSFYISDKVLRYIIGDSEVLGGGGDK